MSFFGVFLPHYKAGFDGSGLTEFAGSLGVRVSSYSNFEVPYDSPLWQIFTDKLNALNMLKRYKSGRLREFPSRQQAEHFVKFGVGSIKPVKRILRVKAAKKSSQNAAPSTAVSNATRGRLAAAVSLPNLYSPSVSGSDSYSGERQTFRTPSKQDFNQFRRYIETGHYEHVKRLIWINPRLLISSGDTPTSLKEGNRCNAMHICAQLNQVRIAELILKVISDGKLTSSLVGGKNKPETCATMSSNLLDYYLNMPDNIRGETPLHFAAKNCYLPMVELLISYPQCKSLRNTNGRYPRDVIGHRQWNASPKLIAKLQLLLSNPYYVPVLRACDNELPPQIGQPFTPSDPPQLQGRIMETDHFVVKLRISALAGPMTREQAYSFYRRWKMPSRRPYMAMYESAGEPFTPHKDTLMSNYRQRHIKNSDIEKGLEVIGRHLAHQEQIDWHEYWDFIDGFMDISSRSGLNNLESYLTNKSSEAQISMLAEKPTKVMNVHKMDKYFDAVADLGFRNNITVTAGRICEMNRLQTPFTCVDKSLVVFSRRIVKTLFRYMDNLLLLNLKLHTELKRLNYLILSFKDDARFITVDFAKVHSRIAELVASNVHYSQNMGIVRRYELMIILRQLSQLTADSCKHLHCVCTRVFLQLEQVPAVQLSDRLQTEQRCSAVWQLAQCCNCRWELAHSARHITGRRQLKDTPRHVQEHSDEQLLSIMVKQSTSKAINVAVVNPVYTINENAAINNEYIENEEESVFYECYETLCSEMDEKEEQEEEEDGDEDEGENEVFYTPAHSRDSITLDELESCSVPFICGKKPTKRDADVLLALSHVDVDQETYPHVHAWLKSMRRYTSVEDKYFLPPIEHKSCIARECKVPSQSQNIRSTIATMPLVSTMPTTELSITPNPERNTALLPWSTAAMNISHTLYRKLIKLSVLLKNRKTETDLVAD